MGREDGGNGRNGSPDGEGDHAAVGEGGHAATQTPLHPNQIWVLRIRAAIFSLFPIFAFWILDRSLPRTRRSRRG